MDGRVDEGGDHSSDIAELQWNEPVDAGRITAMAACPDGHGIVAALRTETGGAEWILADVLPDAATKIIRRIAAGPTPVAEIQVSTDGHRIIFATTENTFTQSVWVMPMDGSSTEPRLVRQGVLPLTRGATSPDGKRLALAEPDPAHGAGLIVVVSLDGEQPEINLGEGLSPVWLPSGAGIVAAAPDHKNHLQLISIAMDEDHPRKQLTYLDTGILPMCAVSSDGRWAVAPAAGTESPSLVLVNLSQAGV
jgi:Tol biopolymer transport system component